MVFQDGLHTGQRGISGAFAQPVDGGMQATATAQDGGQHIGDGQVVIVVGMKIEMSIGIALLHFAHKLNNLQRIENAQRIGQHEAADAGAAECIHQLEHILGRILHAVAPVFQIDIDLHVKPFGIIYHGLDVGNVLLRRLLQLVGAVLQRALA